MLFRSRTLHGWQWLGRWSSASSFRGLDDRLGRELVDLAVARDRELHGTDAANVMTCAVPDQDQLGAVRFRDLAQGSD